MLAIVLRSMAMEQLDELEHHTNLNDVAAFVVLMANEAIRGMMRPMTYPPVELRSSIPNQSFVEPALAKT